MALEMLVKFIDSMRQKRNLHFGLAGIAGMRPEVFDNFSLFFPGQHNLQISLSPVAYELIPI